MPVTYDMASPSSPDLSHFLSIPWCAALLSAPDTTILPSPARIPKASTEDALFAETFKTADTISALLSFFTRLPAGQAIQEEIHTLTSLGYRLNGFPNVVHGGAVVALIDEAMGIFLGLNRDRGVILSTDLVTADLRVKFLRPVATPQTVLISVRLQEASGRKYVLEADLKDASGAVLAKGEAVWIAVRASL